MQIVTHTDWDGRLVTPPAGRVAAYKAAGEWSEDPLGRSFHISALRHAERTAVATETASITYAELDRRTDQIAAALLALGFQRLDPVIFQVTNQLATVLAWYGCIKAGLVPVATLAAHRMHEIATISRKVGAVGHLVEAGMKFDLVAFGADVADGHPTLRHLLSIGAPADDARAIRIENLGEDIAPAAARRQVEQIEAQTSPLDIAVFQLSGGTTGVPKVIPRLHAEYWTNAVLYARRLGWDADRTVAHLIPIIHNAGISCALHAAHSVGAALVLTSADPLQAFPLMARESADTVLFGHGHYQALLLSEFDQARTSLRQVVLSGAKVDDALFGRVDDGRTCWAGQMFGMSEGLFTVSLAGSSREARQTTVGVPIADCDEVRIIDPATDEDLADGQVGELCCRGPYTISGYFDAPEHNAVAFTPDGFFRTGDLAAIRTFGDIRHVSMEGRIKDLINRGGEKINAEEVEQLLVTHPRVFNAAVVAMPDPRLGEKTCAYIVTVDGSELLLEQVRTHLEQLGVAKFKWPERIETVEALPLTNVGKINKKALRARIADMIAAQ